MPTADADARLRRWVAQNNVFQSACAAVTQGRYTGASPASVPERAGLRYRSSEGTRGTVLEDRRVRAARPCLAALLAAPKAAVLFITARGLPAERPVMHPNPPRTTFGYDARDAVPFGA
jgi:hypothetical protein